MSHWRDLAAEQMPSLKHFIEVTENPMALWIELEFRLDDAYEEANQDLIQQIYGYARWSYFEAQDADVVEAVACAFYEHLSLNPVVKKDLPNWLTYPEFKALTAVLHYHQSDEEFLELRDCFDRKALGSREVQEGPRT